LAQKLFSNFQMRRGRYFRCYWRREGILNNNPTLSRLSVSNEYGSKIVRNNFISWDFILELRITAPVFDVASSLTASAQKGLDRIRRSESLSDLGLCTILDFGVQQHRHQSCISCAWRALVPYAIR